jgi:hypothetical protein
LLLSPFDFPEFASGCIEPLGLISLITWEQSSLKCIREDTDLSDPLEGEEGVGMFYRKSVIVIDGKNNNDEDEQDQKR